MKDDENSKSEEFTLNTRSPFKPEESEDSTEGWLISYADLMTLIACFFILMMAFANFEKPTYQEMANAVAKYFKGANVSKDENLMTAMMVKIEAVTDLKDVIDIRVNLNGIEIVFKTSHLFDSGSADLKPKARGYLDELIRIISDKSKKFNIVINGHTDHVPIGQGVEIRKYFQSNWELSAMRASHIARFFHEHGYPGDNLRAVGYADSEPEVPNFDESGGEIPANMARNRRVVISVSKPTPQGFKMGFGRIYKIKTKKKFQPEFSKKNDLNEKNTKKIENKENEK